MSVTLVPASSLESGGGQTPGMVRQLAISNLSSQLSSSVMIAQPHTASGIHHHGEQDTIVYGVKGTGTIIFNSGAKRVQVTPGDWALIPAGADHQEVNEGDEEVVWAIIRGGREPAVVNVDDWRDNAESK